jgi:hypothetical protein
VKKKREKNDAVFYFAAERLFFYIDDVITSPEKEKRSTYHYSLSLSLSHTHTHTATYNVLMSYDMLPVSCSRAHARARIHSHIHARAQHTHTHTHTRTHTHMCGHTPPPTPKLSVRPKDGARFRPPPSAPPAPPPRLSARVNSLFSEGDSAFELASAQDSIEKNRVKCLELGSRTKASWAVGIESPGRHMLRHMTHMYPPPHMAGFRVAR